ncbi:hypothetical protein GOBAR_AA07817 [Gossypium barbadense]|uniref:DUF4283 domain-containing protein n=1 Tax=Gossypium barbadense TaxID=3634 RepID=A0A2P5YB81_GOSBA|nr:hypothetical protein GOBAR_AA07817 [Gossypium barbadense]
MLSTLQNFDNGGEGVAHPDDDRNTKKVRFKVNGVEEETSMAVDHEPQPSMTWKEKLLGVHGAASESVRDGPSADNENEFELLEGDVNMSIIDGIPVIDFSGRVKEILFKEMELTIIVKLLGRNIGYNTLHNRILFFWNPTNSIKIMDITNGYFLVKFQDPNDYNRVLSQGPWTVYSQYLTVQPWTKHFSPLQPYPSVVLAWIRLLNLSGYLYKRKIIEAISGLIGKVVKLDVQTDNQTIGRFARLAVYLNLDRLLISQVLVDGIAQRVEYEALPTVCFTCGRYGQVKEMCNSAVSSQNLTGHANKTDKPHADLTTVADSTPVDSIDGEKLISVNREKGPEFEPWMLVEKKASRAISGRRLNHEIWVGFDHGIGTGFKHSTKGFLGISLNGDSAVKLKKLDSNGIKEVNNSFMVKGQRKSKSLGLSKEPDLKELLDNNVNNIMGQKSKASLDKNLGKRPMGSEGDKTLSIQQDSSETKSVEFLELGPNSKPKGPKKRRNSGRESAESMVAMAELLSPQVLGLNLNVELDGANSKSDCNIDPENQV